MIIDTSAVIAIMLQEPSASGLYEKLMDAPMLAIGDPSLVEAGLVLTGRSRVDPTGLLKRFMEEAEVEIIPFTATHWPHAIDAFFRFGKGRHKAALNFGDCLTYAVAKLSGDALLCTGNDFKYTDLPLA